MATVGALPNLECEHCGDRHYSADPDIAVVRGDRCEHCGTELAIVSSRPRGPWRIQLVHDRTQEVASYDIHAATVNELLARAYVRLRREHPDDDVKLWTLAWWGPATAPQEALN